MKNLFSALTLFFALSGSHAQAVPFGFALDTGGGIPINQGYQGFNYNGFNGVFTWANNAKFPLMPQSTLGSAYAPGAGQMILTSATPGGLFNVAAVEMFADFPQTLTIEGLLLGAVVNSTSLFVSNVYTNVPLNFNGIDEMRFTQSSLNGNQAIGSIDASFGAVVVGAPELDGAAGSVPFVAVLMLLGLFASRRPSTRSQTL